MEMDAYKETLELIEYAANEPFFPCNIGASGRPTYQSLLTSIRCIQMFLAELKDGKIS